MGAEENILKLLNSSPEGLSTSEIAAGTGHTRATAAKYLEMMKIRGMADARNVGKAKLWVSASKKKKILIAEDEPHIRRLITVILGRENHDLVEAANGEQALEMVSEHMPDLVILDLMMPKIDGIEVCRQLKRNALTKKIPVIMLTAKGEMTDKVVGITAGADDYMTKPFDPAELRTRVKTFLERHDSERNPVTNLPSRSYVLKKLASLGGNPDIYRVVLVNIGVYRSSYGHGKANELIRLTSQIITHNLDCSTDSFAGHDSENNFIVVAGKSSASILKQISEEFASSVPFFYNIDYESVNLKKNIVTMMSSKGETKEIPLVRLAVSRTDRKSI